MNESYFFDVFPVLYNKVQILSECVARPGSFLTGFVLLFDFQACATPCKPPNYFKRK